MDLTELLAVVADQGSFGLAVLVVFMVVKWKREDDVAHAQELARRADRADERMRFIAGVLEANTAALVELRSAMTAFFSSRTPS